MSYDMQYDGYSELVGAAPKRLADAKRLVEALPASVTDSDAAYRHLCGAYYLAGYAVECVLKAYIIARYRFSPRLDERRWAAVVRRLGKGGERDVGGKRGHSLTLLFELSGLDKQMANDRRAEQSWRACQNWRFYMRYCPHYTERRGPVRNRKQVEEMVRDCETVYDWVRKML